MNKDLIEAEAQIRTKRALQRIDAVLQEENCYLEPKITFIGNIKTIGEVIVLANPIKIEEVKPETPAVEEKPAEEVVEEAKPDEETPAEGGTN